MTHPIAMVVVAALLLLPACADESEPVQVGAPGGPSPESESIAHRVLADGVPAGDPWTTGVARSDTDLEPYAPGAEVDWDLEVVFVFTLAESGSCPFGPVEDLRFDRPSLRVHPVVPPAGEYDACTDDANPHSVVVAVPRSALPDGQFSLWVDGQEPPAGVVDGVTHIAAGELERPDPTDGPEGRPALLGMPGDLAVGETRIAHELTTHCGLEHLFWPIDGRYWTVEDPGSIGDDSVPPEWRPVVRGEAIDLRIERVEADRLMVTAVGTELTLAYVPTDLDLGCD